ncbi:MAG: outer membrane homotrimeric porin [Pseudomonadota bacterium]
MKRIMTLLLAAGIIFSAQQAQAADIKVRGSWDFSFEFLDNVDVQKESDRNNNQDTFGAKQRLRTQIDIAASESLSGTIYFEVGDTVWGQEDGALGTDGVALEIKRSYIDWMMPYSNLQIRMGLQGYALPGFVAGSPILDDDAAGITLSYTFDDMISLTAFWARPYDLNADFNDNTNAITDNDQYDEMDMFGLIVPINVDGMKIVPWAMYASIGESLYGAADESLTGYNSGSMEAALAGLAPVANASTASYNLDSTASAWWAGLSYELNLFDPFCFKIDGIYGGVDTGEDALDRSGWLVIAALDYQMDMMTPGIFGWYGSGDDSSTSNGSEMMPYVSPDFGPTSFGMAYYASDISTSSVLSMSAAGTWAIGLQLADLTFIEDVSHILRVTYFNGTNDKSAVKNSSLASDGPAVSGFGIYLTEEDNAIEVNFDTTYQIYENLTMVAELGYIDLNLDSSVWGSGYDSYDNMWKVSFNLQYAF